MIEYYDFWKKYAIEPLSKTLYYDKDKYSDYCMRSHLEINARRKGIKRYGFAIPNHEALEAIVELHQPIVEIGAGTGYWCYLLRQRGVDIVAYDTKNSQHKFEREWTDIVQGDHTNLVIEYCSRVGQRTILC